METLVHKKLKEQIAREKRYPTKTVYLAGPITGLTYGEARHGWREEFALMLLEHIVPLSPMRGKDFLMGERNLKGDPNMYPTNPLARPSGILARDRNDVRTCDVVVACFLGAMDHPSLGTAVEFGWADAYRKPLVMVIEDDLTVPHVDKDGHTVQLINSNEKPNIHLHAFLTEIAGYRTNNLEEAAQIVKCLLTPGV